MGATVLAREQRRLAAILAADVVGYARLMGRDESGTLARLKEHRRERLEPALARNTGRLVKLTGDGALVEFGSAVDALRAAIEFQQAVFDVNRDRPDEHRIDFRIGMHVGDLIVDGDDLIGDAVNIAARLEAAAMPGGIIVSRAVREAVDGRLDARLHALGELALKNIDRPVRAFRVEWDEGAWRAGALAELGSAVSPAPALTLPDKPSIAVLRFQNMGGGPEQEYFADGMVEDIITGLSRFRSLFVIARNSSFAYKGSPDVRQVGRELGVRYVLEGSVRKAGVRVRITGQLVDAATGVHLWADRFDGELADVFELQDRITSCVVGVIAPMVERAELERARCKPAASLQAYEKVLRAVALERSRSRSDLEEAIRILREVIRSDPEYARAYAQLSRMCWVYIGQGFGHRDHALVSDFVALAQRGLELDPTDAHVMGIAALAIAYGGGDMQAGVDLAEKAIRLNPNFATAYLVGGVLNGYLGEVDRAIECTRHAERLNPLAASFSSNDVRFIASFGVSDHEAVVEATARALREHPNSGPALRYRGASLALLGRIEEARKVVGRLIETRPGYCIAEVRRHYEFDLNNPFRKPGVTESLYRGLRLAGLPE